MKNNYLGNALSNAEHKVKYDTQIKKILSDKTILAWILKYTVKEFGSYSIETIRTCIEGEPQIGNIPVEPGSKPRQAITGMGHEDAVPNEGVITYDIRFYVITPSKERMKMLINVEAQKSYYPGYDLVTRALFYCARMLSAQKDTEFQGDDYDNIKKVYSVWICMNTPKYAQNTITEYGIHENKLVGDFKGNARYDLQSAIMVCLGEQKKGSNPLLRMLDMLLSVEMSVKEKKEVLQEEFAIETSEKLEKGLVNMCNLSDIIEEKGIEKGIEQGEQNLASAIKELRSGMDYEEVCRKYGERTAAKAKELQ